MFKSKKMKLIVFLVLLNLSFVFSQISDLRYTVVGRSFFLISVTGIQWYK